AREAPLTFTLPTEAVHAMPLGRTGDPPFVTRTEATTVDPAFGFVAARLAALALALRPPDARAVPLSPPLSTTSNLSVALLFDMSGSGCSPVTEALMAYGPG